MIDAALRDILAELKAIRLLLEQDRGPFVEAIGKPLPRGPQLTGTTITMSHDRTIRNLTNAQARAIRGS